MKFKRNLVAAVFAISTSLTSTSSHAYVLPVIEIPNLVQTIVIAFQAIEDYYIQYKKYEQMIKMTKNELEGLEDAIGKPHAEEAHIGLQLSLNQLKETLQSQGGVAEELKNRYGASNQSPEQYMESLKKQYKSGDQRVVSLMDQFHANSMVIEDAHKSFEKMADASKNISGPTEGLQAVNTSIGILIKQQASLLSLRQGDTIKEADEQAQKNRSLEGVTSYEANHQKRMKAAN